MAFDKDAFLTALDSMTVMELNDLVKAIEEKFGVSAAAMAAPAAGGGGGGGGAAATRRARVVRVAPELSSCGTRFPQYPPRISWRQPDPTLLSATTVRRRLTISLLTTR